MNRIKYFESKKSDYFILPVCRVIEVSVSPYKILSRLALTAYFEKEEFYSYQMYFPTNVCMVDTAVC